jgi:hypothetical protein
VLRERQAEVLKEERRAAEDYIESVRDQVSRKVEIERASDGESQSGYESCTDRGAGLIIVEARYGPVKNMNNSNTIDVAIPLQLLVNGSQLVIPGGRSKVRTGGIGQGHRSDSVASINFLLFLFLSLGTHRIFAVSLSHRQVCSDSMTPALESASACG